jgi:hypothetical protein
MRGGVCWVLTEFVTNLPFETLQIILLGHVHICHGLAMKLLQSLAFLANTNFSFLDCDPKTGQNTD